jgi:hypothetical protein
MRLVKVNKTSLLVELRKNRELHEKDVRLAEEGYEILVVKKLEQKIKAVKEGKMFRVIQFDVPEDHLKDYDRAIRMMEMEVEDVIELTEQDFNQYVMDEWNWKDNWSTSNSAYFASASLKSR